MEKVYLHTLRDKIFKRITMIPIDGLHEILALNENFSGDQIVYELFYEALRTFENYHPLFLEMNIYYSNESSKRPGYCELQDNFDLYIRGMISEDQITLIPNSIQGIRLPGSYVSPGNYFRVTDYSRPYLQSAWTSDGWYIVRGICNRPIVEAYTLDYKFQPPAAIYYMSLDGAMGKALIDQCTINILEYIRNLKMNFMLPNFPIDIFSAADIAYNSLKTELDQYYYQSLSRGELLI